VSLFVVALFALASALVQSDHPANRDTTLQFVIRTLSLPKGAISGAASGINRHSMVVGTSSSGGTETAEVWRIARSRGVINRFDYPAPRAYAASSLAAVNDSGLAVGSLTSPPDGSGVSSSTPAYLEKGRWKILHGRASARLEGFCEAIASNGEITASLWNSRIEGNAAATFSLSRGRYHGPNLLPIPPSADGSDGGAVFSLRRWTLVGGYELFRGRDGLNVEIPVVWVNGGAAHVVNTSATGLNQPNFDITSLYGTRLDRIYATGFGLENENGVTATEAFVVRIDLTGGRVRISPAKLLPVPSGADFSYATSIGGGDQADPAHFTVGGNVSDWAGGTAAAVWNLSSSARFPTVSSYATLGGSSSPTGSGCPTYEIQAVSSAGSGAGYAYCNGVILPTVALVKP
jgi:hypothetical protein